MPRDERTYITVHDGMPEHPKVEGLSDAAFRLMVDTWCWCSRNRTDGKIRAASWVKRGTAKARAELLAEGLIEETDGDFYVHDYTQHQRTAAEIDELSARRKAAGAKGGRASATARASASPSAQAKTQPEGSKTQAESETDTSQQTSSVVTRKRGHRIPEDWKPTPADIDWARTKGIDDLTQRRQTERFVNHFVAASGQSAVKLDWSRAWKNWLDRDAERTAPGRPTGTTGQEYTPW